MFSCNCFFNRSGDYCSFYERDLQILNNVTYVILFNLQQIELTDDVIMKIAKILQNMAHIDDALNKKSFRIYQIILNGIVKYNVEHLDIYSRKRFLYSIN